MFNANKKNLKSLLTASLTGILVLGCSQRDPHFSLLGKSQGFLSAPVNNKVDILWVIDNSGTMGPKQTNLANSINAFMTQFITKQFDFHIAVVTTDIRPIDPLNPLDPNFSGQDACIVGTPQIILPTTPNPVAALAANANVGFFGSADAHGLDAARLALSAPNVTGCNAGFLRADAYLAIIEFSDADDNTAATVGNLLTFLDTIKPPVSTPTGSSYRPYFMSAMVAPDVTSPACIALGPFTEKGVKFLDAATLTKGPIANICDADFSAGLLAVSTKILEQATAVHLASVPDVDTIQVFQDTVTIAQSATNGWTYDAESTSIVFHGAAIPIGANILITVNFTPIDIVR